MGWSKWCSSGGYFLLERWFRSYLHQLEVKQSKQCKWWTTLCLGKEKLNKVSNRCLVFWKNCPRKAVMICVMINPKNELMDFNFDFSKSVTLNSKFLLNLWLKHFTLHYFQQCTRSSISSNLLLIHFLLKSNTSPDLTTEWLDFENVKAFNIKIWFVG